MKRTSPQELEQAFSLFELSTEAERERFHALTVLGELDAKLGAGCDTVDRNNERNTNAELARTTAGR